ncbi:DUF948 domain-containing protein [Sporosarcina sp. Marseille-Q4063]|uniref:DUF948 domain-containing protein n=1 Tax=Sporosarcina sp. Marseille-Q4063 TaxID=2810514 RepID=UPI001BAF4A59|nr:DUF948 domain-containing protein [Sporosarcina sp. Marseille-Q4063]QUW22418.1 DUF948 domain-containing protein [Sporosarcina sp. Marseille-Q4063]
MGLLEIGVLIIGIAFAVLVLFLIKPIKKLTDVLENLKETTEKLPESFVTITDQTTSVLQEGNKTIENVNDQVKELRPIFEIVGDVGEASQELTNSTLQKTIAFKQRTSEAVEFTNRKQYEGLFGLMSMIYYLSQNKFLKEKISKNK